MKTELIRLDKQFRKYCPICSKVDEWQDGCTVAIESENPVWLIKRNGKYGEFWGCPNFPKCEFTISIRKYQYLWTDDDEFCCNDLQG